MDNIKAVFCGHDHNNDFWGHYYGIDLYFGRKTGHGGYGPPKGMKRGARILEFSLDQNETVQLDSWIRQEDGSKHVQSKSGHKNVTKGAQCLDMHPDETVFIADLLNKST